MTLGSFLPNRTVAVCAPGVLACNIWRVGPWERVRLAQGLRRKGISELAAKKAAEEVAVEKPSVQTGVLVRVLVAAWLIPGLGHFLLRRKGRALILFASILSMFVFGVLMQGEFFALHSPSYLRTLGFFGEMCVGVAMPAARFFGYAGGDPYFVTSDYGTAFLVAAGMLNALTVLDAYDIAIGRKP